jgi:hypothetical protein
MPMQSRKAGRKEGRKKGRQERRKVGREERGKYRFGRTYFGTDGRGILYGEPTPTGR